LAEGKIIPLTPTDSNEKASTENDKHLSLWFPILTGLSGIIGHSHIDVRTAALKALFNILSSYGSMFNKNFWQLMFRGVLLPIFDNVRYAGGNDLLKEDNEWLTTTCLLALNSLIDLFATFFNDISFLLGEFLSLLASCILQENESLARIGATCFLQLVMTNGNKFDEEMWTLVCTRLAYILENNAPVELIQTEQQQTGSTTAANSGGDQKNGEQQFSTIAIATGAQSQAPSSTTNVTTSPASPAATKESSVISKSAETKMPTAVAKVIRGKCTVQLGLFEALNEIAFTHYSSLTTQHLESLLDSLERGYVFCRQANHNPELRAKVEKLGKLIV
jgi:brefeldin A-inhibited guanine nucleotide-exchange protein